MYLYWLKPLFVSNVLIFVIVTYIVIVLCMYMYYVYMYTCIYIPDIICCIKHNTKISTIIGARNPLINEYMPEGG